LKLLIRVKEFSGAFFFVFYRKPTSLRKANEKDSASMSYKQTRRNSFKPSVRKQNVFTLLMTVYVRWPAKNSGAFVFGLNFWFFWFKPKEQKKIFPIHLSNDL
jgi:hypothetical protein